jgi:hypothetical protein
MRNDRERAGPTAGVLWLSAPFRWGFSARRVRQGNSYIYIFSSCLKQLAGVHWHPAGAEGCSTKHPRCAKEIGEGGDSIMAKAKKKVAKKKVAKKKK